MRKIKNTKPSPGRFQNGVDHEDHEVLEEHDTRKISPKIRKSERVSKPRRSRRVSSPRDIEEEDAPPRRFAIDSATIEENRRGHPVSRWQALSVSSFPCFRPLFSATSAVFVRTYHAPHYASAGTRTTKHTSWTHLERCCAPHPRCPGRRTTRSPPEGPYSGGQPP